VLFVGVKLFSPLYSPPTLSGLTFQYSRLVMGKDTDSIKDRRGARGSRGLPLACSITMLCFGSTAKVQADPCSAALSILPSRSSEAN
jgi:hypothetical protein